MGFGVAKAELGSFTSDFWKGGGLVLGGVTRRLTLLFFPNTHAAEAINCLNAAIDIYTDMVSSCPGSPGSHARLRDAAKNAGRAPPVSPAPLPPPGPLHHRRQAPHHHRRDLRGRAGGHREGKAAGCCGRVSFASSRPASLPSDGFTSAGRSLRPSEAPG